MVGYLDPIEWQTALVAELDQDGIVALIRRCASLRGNGGPVNVEISGSVNGEQPLRARIMVLPAPDYGDELARCRKAPPPPPPPPPSGPWEADPPSPHPRG